MKNPVLNKVALILPYFGRLPKYFGAFLDSLSNIPMDVLFFSDIHIEKHPPNFKQVRMNFNELKHLFRDKMAMEVVMDSPKRLCDFKPMYGCIFHEWIVDYDYWAFGDCDLLYGIKFAVLLKEAIDQRVDILSLHRTYISGPFCMLRNSHNINNLWRKAENVELVAKSRGLDCVGFDELMGDFHAQLSNNEMTIEQVSKMCGDSFTAVVHRSANQLKISFSDLINEDTLIKGFVSFAPDGTLKLNDKDIYVYHYVCAKLRSFFRYVDCKYPLQSLIIIDDAGFYVSSIEKKSRFMINKLRKVVAAIRSIKRYGLNRIVKQWK